MTSPEESSAPASRRDSARPSLSRPQDASYHRSRRWGRQICLGGVLQGRDRQRRIPARTTCTPCANSWPGAGARKAGLLDITPGASASISRSWTSPSRPRSCTWRPCGSSSTGWSTATSIVINPAATVRAERYSVVEGKTPEIQRKQAETLLKSIETTYEVESEIRPDLVGLRDRAILAVLVFTAARVGAVAKLTFKNLRHDGTEYTLRFSEKGGKSREIPVRSDLQKILLAYIQAAGISDGPLFRTALGKTRTLTGNPMTGDRHLPHDEAAAQGGRAPHRLLAPFVPRHDHHRPAGAQHVPWKTSSTWPATPTRARPASTTAGGARSPATSSSASPSILDEE